MALPTDAFTGIVHPEVRAYLDHLLGDDDPLLAEMEAHCANNGFPLIGRTSGRWLELLTRMSGARRVFEFGSGFGYSAFFFARAVGPEGSVWGAEKDAHELEHHARFYAGHPLAPRIHLREGWADDVFDATEGTFGAILLDCDKEGYIRSLEHALPRLDPGALVFADNVLWGGRVAREADADSTRALQAFNRHVAQHPALDGLILPSGDGLMVARKK